MHPKLRVFIVVPILVNIILLIALTSVFIGFFTAFVTYTESGIPSWLSWLTPFIWVFWALGGILLLLIYGYCFNIITNILAAPFYGVLAEKTEKLLSGEAPPSETLARMIPRVFIRELRKLIYFITRGILVSLILALLTFFPFVNFIVPFLGIAWGAWCMAIQYSDYAADNHQVSFNALRTSLWKNSFSSVGFGGMVMACSMIPVINIFAMPAAVTGGTCYWLDELKKNHCSTEY